MAINPCKCGYSGIMNIEHIHPGQSPIWLSRLQCPSCEKWSSRSVNHDDLVESSIEAIEIFNEEQLLGAKK